MINMKDNLKYKICRILKAVQFFFVLLVLILEIVQVTSFPQFFRKLVNYLRSEGYNNSDYNNNSNSSDYYVPLYFTSPTILALLDPSLNLNPEELYFKNASVGKGPAVIWVFIVIIISFLSLVGYTLLFSKIWNFREHILFIEFDAAFVLLWVSEVFTNLIWVYNGTNSPCFIIGISDYYSLFVSLLFPELKTVCGAYTASNVFGWFVLVSFIIGFGFSFKVYKDAKSEAFNNKNIDDIDKINNTTIILQPPQQIQEKSLHERAESLQERPPSTE